MALWEVSFRISYDYPFIDLSRDLPGIALSMWCIWNRELLQVPTREPSVLERVEKAVRRAGKVVEDWTESAAGKIFLLRCTCDRYDSVWNVFDEHRAIDAPPAVFENGWGYWRAISFSENDVRGLFKDLNRRGTVELLRKRELPLSVLPTSVWANSLFSGLTGKQMDAMLKAHRYGYYSSPRQITTDSIARGIGLSRSTYEEHLRKAENKIVASLVPYLQLYAAGERKPEQMPSPATVVEPVDEPAQ